MCLCAISATALIAAVFGEGHYEETKHLYLFYTSNVLLLALSVGAVVNLTAGHLTAGVDVPGRATRPG